MKKLLLISTLLLVACNNQKSDSITQAPKISSLKTLEKNVSYDLDYWIIEVEGEKLIVVSSSGTGLAIRPLKLANEK